MKINLSEKQVIAIKVAGYTLAIGCALAAIAASAALFSYTQFRVNQISEAHAFNQCVATQQELLATFQQGAFVEFVCELKELAGPQSESWSNWQWQEWWIANVPRHEMSAYFSHNPDQLSALFNQLTNTSLEQLNTTLDQLVARLDILSDQLEQFDPKLMEQAWDYVLNTEVKP